jgi:16S rRNA (cytosine967-C5)-methyltransferase
MILQLSPTLSFRLQIPSALLRGIQTCVEDIFLLNSWSDKAVAKMLSEHKAWGSRDRKIAANIVYTIVRKYVIFREICDSYFCIPANDESARLNGLIVLGTYFSYPEKTEPSLDHVLQGIDKPWLKYSLQEWIYKRLLSNWGTSADELMSNLDQPAPVFIRRNRLKVNQLTFEKALKESGTTYHICKEVEDAYLIEGPNQLRNSKAFREGWMEFQDIGSQMIISRIGISGKMTVVDYCAGKGGKTLHIASLLNNSGRLIASDIESKRLQQLIRRSEKAGVRQLEVFDTDKLLQQDIQADVVLIDVPCTGSGTFRRQPDLKFRLKEESLEEVLPIQREILMKASALVKKGGKLVFATCSVFKEEDEMQVKWFTEQKEGVFELIEQAYITPPQYNSDGFYVAIMQRVK